MMKCFLIAALTTLSLVSDSSASVPTAALTFDTNVQVFNMTKAQEYKVRDAEEVIREVVGSAEFRTAILNHTYNGKKTFVDNKGLSNSQIYNKILEAAEIKYSKKNNSMDMGMKLYYENSNTVGFTTPAITYINANTKFFNKYTPKQVARNMIHEWLHKLGFNHAVKATKSREYSVPYAVGTILAKIAARL